MERWKDFKQHHTASKQKKFQVYFKSYTVLVFVLKV